MSGEHDRGGSGNDGTPAVAMFSICLRVLETIETVNHGGEIPRFGGSFGFSSGHESREQVPLLLQRGKHRVEGRSS